MCRRNGRGNPVARAGLNEAILCVPQEWLGQSCAQARIARPAPGPHVGVEFVTGHVCFFSYTSKTLLKELKR